MRREGRRGALSEIIDLARVALGLIGLSAAAYTDLKTREVPDGLWYGLGAGGLALLALGLNETFGGQAWLLVLPVGLLFIVALTGGEIFPVVPGDVEIPEDFEPTPRQRMIMRLDVAAALGLIGAGLLFFFLLDRQDLGPRPFLAGAEVQAYAVSIMFGVAIALFELSLISGGADAKALMVLAALFPVPPAIQGLPLLHPPGLTLALIPFSLAVFFNGAILLVLVKLPLFPLIGRRTGRVHFPESFFGFEKPVAAINLEREWILGAVVEGEWKRRLMPTHDSHSDEAQKAALAFLQAKGTAAVFVTPKLPFMLYLLGGLVAALLLSSPLYFVGG